jgi:hypothetical protein
LKVGFNGIHFVRFGIRMGEILNFKWFLPRKFQINHRKLGFGRKNQLKIWSHLEVYYSIQVWGIRMCLWCCWKDFNEKIWWNLFHNRFEFKMWEISKLKWFISLQFQINYKKLGFRRKNQLRMCSHLQVIFTSSKIGYKV